MGNSDATSNFKSTPAAEVDKKLALARQAYSSGRTRDISWRKKQLRQLYRLIDDNSDAICKAVALDFRKPKTETYLSEVLIDLNNVVYTLDNIDKWTAPEYPEKGLAELGAGLTIRKEPFGVALIIAPWNYPIDIVLKPLTSAIAAGNAAICKPSEVTPHCAMLLAELFPKYLDREVYHVVNGGVKETTYLLDKQFDQITYTGSTAVGKIIMAAAAKHLTPVVLELGGKSPVVIDPALPLSEIERVAARLGNTKTFNGGQTCVAPDYVLCPPHLVRPLSTAIANYFDRSFGKNPRASPDFARIVNTSHTKRLGGLIDKQKATPGTVCVAGGEWNESECYVAPTVFVGVKGDDPVMSQELFGPILGIVEVPSTQAALDFINARDRPLALYVYTKSNAFAEKVHNTCISGSVVVNDCLYQYAVDSAPFGGVGASGMGSLHGYQGFLAFSHQKTVLAKPLDWPSEFMNSSIISRYPPYTDSGLNTVKALAQKSLPSEGNLLMRVAVLAGAAAAGYALYSRRR